ncbi:hypothetical protein HMPREF0973_00510 [Prevotella veroralis F0319]|uniref:Uncharacterized protein n=1 Tax=Prevotella veroralis F0319 TaxID=649761 RepID=C9MLN5_9BACT|nr:hypothetical protein HMPREF0973_00510 [Prevotella veroralis F0319]
MLVLYSLRSPSKQICAFLKWKKAFLECEKRLPLIASKAFL